MYDKPYVLLTDESLLRQFDIDGIRWGDKGSMGVGLADLTERDQQALEQIRQSIAEMYVQPIFGNHTIAKTEVVDGLDEASISWHNDLIEGPNLGCLLYYDDTDEDTGSMISFRDAETKDVIESFYPKKYNILFINHNPAFEHRVYPQTFPFPRRVVHFNFNVTYED